ncbi:fatty acid desaturase family protein [Rhizobium leguminosarum]|uniref:Fatty acid desaturase n=1 Tax=Rhizobium leguminosarum TaxID=384 RepID=A0A7K3VMK7_RHILE|nr:fatty acid desaturase [Rhizobium leguminosarum]NEK18405.1 fatty acid desaturase [Rhizobium leguminosarum]NEK37399.1 fatty acid desaturase [Rhizobium leguminosarum]
MKIFAHTKWDTVPVLAAIAHLAFNIYLIAGFESRALWQSAVLGAVYAVSISWNINSISHNFIHTPYFKPKWMNYAFSLLESVTIGFSQVYYHWVHMRHHSGNSDRPNENGETVDLLSIYKHGKNGDPENVFSYTFLSFFRDDIGDIHQAIASKRPFEAKWGRFELIAFVVFVLLALFYDWKAAFFFLPFYYLGNCLSSLNGYYEHLNGDPDEPIAWGVGSHNSFYNWLWFGNGYHAEHHYRPKTHWTKLKNFHEQIKQEQEAAGTHVISTCHSLGFMAKENRQQGEFPHAS